ncbi:Protein FAM57B [Acipenser ruthenus]|uniref:Protein FAM57B n=1 Tax=Acipenser ruthenus TaxID=7906 RepID=A0A444V1I9_ACIRT|nr:Protein FAM57B [Acipenser ruthenus]
MLELVAAGSLFFPGLYLLSKRCLKQVPSLQWDEGDAVIISASNFGRRVLVSGEWNAQIFQSPDTAVEEIEVKFDSTL